MTAKIFKGLSTAIDLNQVAAIQFVVRPHHLAVPMQGKAVSREWVALDLENIVREGLWIAPVSMHEYAIRVMLHNGETLYCPAVAKGEGVQDPKGYFEHQLQVLRDLIDAWRETMF